MSIEIDWGDAEQCILVMRFGSKWTGDEFFQSIAQLNSLCGGASQNLELMIDLRKTMTPPSNLITLLASSLNRPRPKNFAQVVIISSFGFWKQMFNILYASYKDKFATPIVFVDNVDKAYSLLKCLENLD
jgi:hypothetical protein